jgi:hypothetical protein
VLFFVTVIIVIHGRPCFLTDAQEDDAFSYPGGLVLVESSGENSVVVGPHIFLVQPGERPFSLTTNA